MPSSAERHYDLVGQDFVAGRTITDQAGTRIVQFTAPKKLAFREDASLLRPRWQEYIGEILSGKRNHEIAQDWRVTHQTVKNYSSDIAKCLREEGLMTVGGIVQVINVLLQVGELELQGQQ